MNNLELTGALYGEINNSGRSWKKYLIEQGWNMEYEGIQGFFTSSTTPGLDKIVDITNYFRIFSYSCKYGKIEIWIPWNEKDTKKNILEALYNNIYGYSI